MYNQQLYVVTAYFSGKEDGSIFKAALLSGPPGVGKTTSAHLVCKVCWDYNNSFEDITNCPVGDSAVTQVAGL